MSYFVRNILSKERLCLFFLLIFVYKYNFYNLI